MNKPDWKDAPEWANWLAQDESGFWGFFSKKTYYVWKFGLGYKRLIRPRR